MTTEKEYIYLIMKDLGKLTDLYSSMKNRLDVLNEAEEASNVPSKPSRVVVPTYTLVKEEVKEEEPVKVKQEVVKPIRKNKRLSTETASIIMEEVLREARLPLKTETFHQRVNERLENPVTLSNFRAGILPKAMKKNPNIIQVRKGLYHYNKD